jgi:hypothetical protein
MVAKYEAPTPRKSGCDGCVDATTTLFRFRGQRRYQNKRLCLCGIVRRVSEWDSFQDKQSVQLHPKNRLPSATMLNHESAICWPIKKAVGLWGIGQLLSRRRWAQYKKREQHE